jgi:hypothetical protein
MTVPIMFHVKAQADRDARSAAGIARLIHVPAAAAVSSPLGSEAASQAQCTAGVIEGRLTVSPAVLSLHAELCGARRCLNQTSIASLCTPAAP